MKVLPKKKKKEIADVLKERQVKWICPMCGNSNFAMLDGYITPSITPDPKKANLGGRVVPSIGVACRRCGFISQHSLGILGLLKKDEGDKDE